MTVQILKPDCNLETIRDGRGGIFTWIPKEPIVEFNMLYFNPGKVRGFHIGNSNEVSRVADLSFLLNEGFSAVNEKFLGGASDTVRHYNRVFNQDLFRLRVLDFSGQISNDDSLLNSTVILDDTSDSDGVQEFTGLIGGDGYIGQPIVNSDTITYGELTNAGLLVNFIYTDTSDSPTTGSHAVNGHFLNETPMGAATVLQNVL